MAERRFVAVDLFCGAGGFSLGAIAAGFRIALAVDNNAHACSSYQKNIVLKAKGKTKIINGDLGLLSAKDLIKQSPELQHNCDLIIGGPPCQGFSSHRLRDTGVGDPRNSLLLRYFEIVSVLTPKFFLVENVPGLLWPRHRNWLDKFYAMATASGYQVSEATPVNAADYGIPQRRKRVFILGTRKDISRAAFPPPATHCDPDTASQQELLPWVPVKGVFKDSKIAGDPNDVHMRHNAELRLAFKSTPINGGSRLQSGRTLRCHTKHDGHFDVYGRIDPSMPAPTMTTACINPSKGRFVHPTAPHGITIRQAARIQTFPDWFVFEGGLMASGEQIGNAVPPMLAEILLRSLREQLRATASADQQAA
jgi:DNA (cytosine-5)-methyltransferase 1